MKITVRTPMKAAQIQELLDGYKANDISLSFLSKSGISMEFEAEGSDADTMVSLVKSLIKDTDFGKVLNFSVTVL